MEWKEGSKKSADFLSRHATSFINIPQQWKQETNEFEKTVWFLQLAPYTEVISMDRIVEDTEKAELLQKLRNCIRKQHIPKTDKDLTCFCKVLPDLTVSDEGLILKDDRIILLELLWKTAIDTQRRASWHEQTQTPTQNTFLAAEPKQTSGGERPTMHWVPTIHEKDNQRTVSSDTACRRPMGRRQYRLIWAYARLPTHWRRTRQLFPFPGRISSTIETPCHSHTCN